MNLSNNEILRKPKWAIKRTRGKPS